MSSTLGMSQETKIWTRDREMPYLNLNLTQWPIWVYHWGMSWISPGARLVDQVQESLKQQTAGTITKPMPYWRKSDSQEHIAFVFLFISSGRVASWWSWISASLASILIIGTGTHGVGVAVLNGRLEGLLTCWRSVLSEVGSTIKPQPLPPETEHLREERGGGQKFWIILVY